VHRQPPVGQRDGDGGLADPAFAHHHHQTVPGRGDLVDQRGQSGQVDRLAGDGVVVDRGVGVGVGVGVQQRAQGVDAHQFLPAQGHQVHRQGCEGVRHRGQRRLLAAAQGRGEIVDRCFVLGHEPVDDQMLTRESDDREFVVDAGGLVQGTAVGPCDQHETGPGRVGQFGDGVGVPLALYSSPANGPGRKTPRGWCR